MSEVPLYWGWHTQDIQPQILALASGYKSFKCLKGLPVRSESVQPEPPLQGFLAHKKPPTLGPYRRPMPRVIGGSAFSYGRGTPVILVGFR